ncbi:16265_t:CDS:2, partial [Dentiscutata heterogama]
MVEKDRSNMAIAIVYMTLEFDFTSTIQGVILSSFFVGYLTTQTLGGALADKYGGKWVLATSAALWTLFTFLTPFAAQAGLGYLLLCRILLGIGEGASFPTVNSLIASWFPTEESSKAVSAIISAAYIGIVVALPISTWLGSGSYGWPSIFWTFGMAGFVWSILWQIYGKSSPNEYPGISQEELDLIIKSKKKKNKHHKNLSYHRIESGEIVIESSTSENDNATSDVPLTSNSVIEENNDIEAEVDALLSEKSTNENDNVTTDVSLTSNSVIEVNNDLDAEVDDVLLPKNLILSNPKEVPWKFLLSRRE